MSQPRISLTEIAQLWNCKYEFQNPCPKAWEELERTETEGVRYCNDCKQSVTYCKTAEQFVKLGNAGQCVAVPDSTSPRSLSRVTMGQPSKDSLRKLERLQDRTEKWWSEAIESNPEFSLDAFSEISTWIKARNTSPKPQSPEDQLYSQNLKEAVKAGPEAVYLFASNRRSGKRENQQILYNVVSLFFPMTFREFLLLAKKGGKEQPD